LPAADPDTFQTTAAIGRPGQDSMFVKEKIHFIDNLIGAGFQAFPASFTFMGIQRNKAGVISSLKYSIYSHLLF
jgi:hypothetical protein